jgi:uncharacterized protein
MDSKKVTVGDAGRRGKGVFARLPIKKGEVIASFDGRIYTADHEPWTNDILNYVIQFAEDKWRDATGIARILNHSCEPNCGIKNLFTIVAMRDIAPREELTWDYEMTENNRYGWRMKCLCGTPSCRKIIGQYDNMPPELRRKYKGYISAWLTGPEACPQR